MNERQEARAERARKKRSVERELVWKEARNHALNINAKENCFEFVFFHRNFQRGTRDRLFVPASLHKTESIKVNWVNV